MISTFIDPYGACRATRGQNRRKKRTRRGLYTSSTSPKRPNAACARTDLWSIHKDATHISADRARRNPIRAAVIQRALNFIPRHSSGTSCCPTHHRCWGRQPRAPDLMAVTPMVPGGSHLLRVKRPKQHVRASRERCNRDEAKDTMCVATPAREDGGLE